MATLLTLFLHNLSVFLSLFSYLRVAEEAQFEDVVVSHEVLGGTNSGDDHHQSLIALEFLRGPNFHLVCSTDLAELCADLWRQQEDGGEVCVCVCVWRMVVQEKQEEEEERCV